MTKSQEISRRILEKAVSIGERDALPTNGPSVMREAFDCVLGEGAYDRMVDDLYDGLRARRAA